MNYGINTNDSNIELITKFLEFGSPMNQIFVIEAISRYAKLVIDQQDELRVSMKDHLIHPEAWIQSAKDFLECSEKRSQ
jgi:hypothetical protein